MFKLSNFFKKLKAQPKVATEQASPQSPEQPGIFSSIERNPTTGEERPMACNIKNHDYLLEPYKAGGICQIFRGLPLKAGAPDISVKMIQTKWRANKDVRRQFSLESQIIRELSHPGLPKYLGRGIIDNRSYYAYEFIDGIQMINLSQRPDLFPKQIVKKLALDVSRQLFEILDVLHTGINPVVHGDISSENIIIDNQHQVYLIDFGCAHYLNMRDQNAKHWVGKPSFISPEQARGEVWDQRSDLYQIGILYYELISGIRWNQGADREAKHKQAANAASPALDFIADQMPIPVSMIFSKVLQPDPEKRFQSAAQVLDALALIKSYRF